MACRDQYKIFLHTYAIIWDNFYLYFPCLLLYSYLCNEPVLIFFPWFIFTTLLHLTYVLYHTHHETHTDAHGEEKAKSRAQSKNHKKVLGCNSAIIHLNKGTLYKSIFLTFLNSTLHKFIFILCKYI